MACTLFLSPASITKASELVWGFINPSFIGGNYLNGSWLLSSAQAQNSHVKSTPGYQREDPITEFEDNLNRELLDRLADKILDEAFGEETDVPLAEGEYRVGNYVINVTTNGAINVQIIDTTSGGTTTIQIPYY
ncbi:MAG: hypothetical protein A2Z25_05790 [Planctomycetes bacterium RBG_16_55_9]|nr:MAG: hypothetical protein A2Z25_05790 [Planctomycetes bacterium RBG_16_55_9]